MQFNNLQDEDKTDEKPPFQYRLRVPLITATAAMLGLVGLAVTQQPARGPVVVMTFLLLMFLFLASLTALAVQQGLRWAGRPNFNAVRLFYLTCLIATGFIFLLGLQTLGQLGGTDIVLVLVFEIILCFYILRRF